MVPVMVVPVEVTLVPLIVVAGPKKVIFAPVWKPVPENVTVPFAPAATWIGAALAIWGPGVTERHAEHVADAPVSDTVTSRAPRAVDEATDAEALMVVAFTTVTPDSVTPVPDTEAVSPATKLVPTMTVATLVAPWGILVGVTEVTLIVVAGVTVLDAADDAPVPMLLVAVTEKV
jgi:hypothetical protein